MTVMSETRAAVDLREWDLILVNSSAGKDSQVTLHVIATAAREAGVLERVHVVHCTFPEEWAGTEDLARDQALRYIPAERFHVVRNLAPSNNGTGSLLERIRNRGQWPDSKTRFCTSDFKRDPVAKLIRNLTPNGGRVLNCLGIRSAESPARSKKNPFKRDERTSSRTREVFTWFPIFDYSLADVWSTIKASGVPYHRAYDAGLPRLSCVFCVFAPKSALILAGRLNRELLSSYSALEREIGHTFRKDLRIQDVEAAVERGEEVTGAISTWEC